MACYTKDANSLSWQDTNRNRRGKDGGIGAKLVVPRTADLLLSMQGSTSLLPGTMSCMTND
eukprot:2252251-Amphidinium_carterae.3